MSKILNARKSIHQDVGIGIVTALAVVGLLLTSMVASPGVYMYNEYAGDGGDKQVRNDGTAAATAGGAVIGGGGLVVGAGSYFGSTALVTVGAVVGTAGLGLGVFGATLVA